AERVLPGVLDLAVPSGGEAALALSLLAARALGVATAADLADYCRLPQADTRAALAEATGSGLLRQVAVEGWGSPAHPPAAARLLAAHLGAGAVEAGETDPAALARPLRAALAAAG